MNLIILKRKVSILLILLYTTVLFVPLNPVIHYVLHKKYYTEVLCENKDKPKMHCNGKCHLKKEIKQTQQESQNPNQPVPTPKTNKEIFPALLQNRSRPDKLSTLNRKELAYVYPYFKDIYLDVITPPPETL